MLLPVLYNDLSVREKRLVREEYVKLQEGNCYYCGDTLSEKPSSKITNKKDKLEITST